MKLKFGVVHYRARPAYERHGLFFGPRLEHYEIRVTVVGSSVLWCDEVYPPKKIDTKYRAFIRRVARSSIERYINGEITKTTPS